MEQTAKKVSKKAVTKESLIAGLTKLAGEMKGRKKYAQIAKEVAEALANAESLSVSELNTFVKGLRARPEFAPATEPKVAAKATNAKAETEAPAEAPAEKPAKKLTKKAAKAEKTDAPATKKPAKVEKPKPAVATREIVSQFPAELDSQIGKLTLVHGIADIAELAKAVTEKTIVFAGFWPKRFIRKFPYSSIVKVPKEFPNDLDLIQMLYVSDQGTVAYGVSIYTEAAFGFLPEELVEEDGIRTSNGMEYAIYEVTATKA